MIADRVRMRKSKGGIPSYYVMATDSDFEGFKNGDFKYKGFDEYIIIPHTIKGVTVTEAPNMFNNPNLHHLLDIKGIATLKGHSITNMSQMFSNFSPYACDFSFFDTSNVTNMSHMFGRTYVYPGETLDLSSFDTSSVTDMSYMFKGCVCEGSTLNISSFDTSSVNNMRQMFRDSYILTLDLSSFDTSNVTNMTYMFQYASTTTGYARTQADANKFNASIGKPAGLNFVVK